MRYVWAFIAYLTVLAVAVMSCGGSTGTNTGAGGSMFTTGTHATSTTTGAMGGGGSSGVFSSGTGAKDGGGNGGGNGGGGADAGPKCPTATTCAAQNANCGSISDGCGGILMCGMCTGNQVCGAGTPPVPNVCGTSCVPTTCMALGVNCGTNGDGCGGMLDCGTCTLPQTCGGGNPGTPNVCGQGVCVPTTTCASQGITCGPAGDNCGNMLDCGTCTAPLTCGGGGVPGACGTMCTPKTCAGLGLNCGPAADGCGGLLECGSCTAPEACNALMPNMCGVPPSCTNLCLQQVTCPDPTVTTTLTGTVYAPNGTDPLVTA